MSTRLLHIADLHLDRAFAGMGCQGELAIRRRLGLREALLRAGRTALERGCAAITIAGDLYESDRSGADTAAFLVETFGSWQPMRVLLAPGNHDPLVGGSIYSRTEWPHNVHVYTETVLEPLELEDGLSVWGLAHREPAWQGDPLARGPGGAPGVHLALFHGAELGARPDGKSIHGPFRAERIRGMGFVAALAGHYHRRRLDLSSGLLYPGSPEPLTFDETEPRGPVLVTVAGDGTMAFEAIEDNRWQARVTACDVSSAHSFAAVLELAVEAAAGTCAGLDPATTMIRLDLEGEAADAVAIDTFTAETVLRERSGLAAVRVRDFTVPTLQLEGRDDGTVRGCFGRTVAAALADAADGDERALLGDALRYGLQALSGAEVGLR